MAAQRKLLKTKYKNMDFVQLARIYQKGQNPYTYANTIAKFSGLDPHRTIGSLSEEELDRFVYGQMKAEGMKKGVIKNAKGEIVKETKDFEGGKKAEKAETEKGATANVKSEEKGTDLPKTEKQAPDSASYFGTVGTGDDADKIKKGAGVPGTTGGSASGLDKKVKENTGDAVGEPIISNSATRKRYETLGPEAKKFFTLFSQYAAKQGIKLSIPWMGANRTKADQAKLYAKGRNGNPGPVVTWTMNSYHIGGRAIDIISDQGYKNKALNEKIAIMMREFSNAHPELGASFLKITKDPNHVQFTGAHKVASVGEGSGVGVPGTGSSDGTVSPSAGGTPVDPFTQETLVQAMNQLQQGLTELNQGMNTMALNIPQPSLNADLFGTIPF
jgi:hypothetical protein